jgi:lipopolysaccharide transport system ATP-binding protein
MRVVIDVDNIGKQYRLGEIGTGTLSHDLRRWFAMTRGKSDPYARIGSVNDRTKSTIDEYSWALKNISFQVTQGSVVGVIGKNGAGKSTLLKIISQITAPTEGQIKIKGRIASLLEVGTGFHPEMTGRENIYMNGTVMGMRKHEIDKKFDEIVDFAGVARYVDTPAKRYSSGMTVRLGFAVAAFLEPEILIVDEVLAVGDAEFQKKALGKMKDVSDSEGRTVLFVSHNMSAVENLCVRSILLEQGTLKLSGKTSDIITAYLQGNPQNADARLADVKERQGNGELRFTDMKLLNGNGEQIESLKSGLDSIIRVFYKASANDMTFTNTRISLAIKKDTNPLIVLSTELTHSRSITLRSDGHVDIVVNNLPL